MNLPLFIARRYFFSTKKKSFINIIAIISMLVVSIGTAALIIVLSVFNGMENLLKTIYGEFDADLQVVPVTGKSFVINEDLIFKINSIEGVMGITEVIEDKALVEYHKNQKIVSLKGLSNQFIQEGRMNEEIKVGKLAFYKDEKPQAIVGRGLQFKLGISIRDEFTPLTFYYPKNISPGQIMNQSTMYSKKNIMTGGVFALEQHYDDNYIFVPIEFTERLFGYKGKRTSLEISVEESKDISKIQDQLAIAIGEGFIIKSGDQQHEDLYKLLEIEKLFVFIIFSIIIGIASINIFFSLSMLVTEKKMDIGILFSMGATRSLIRRLFLLEGTIIAIIGAGTGLILGYVIVWTQETYGLISLGVASAVVQAYPVKMITDDFIMTAVCITVITFIASIQPAIRASQVSAMPER
ncbi:MAG: ABC transporter permease [Reichenbachiella sp.]